MSVNEINLQLQLGDFPKESHECVKFAVVKHLNNIYI